MPIFSLQGNVQAVCANIPFSRSELYGRVIIYNMTNILFLGFNTMCALSQSPSMLLGARFLSGFMGVATITIGSGTIADLMPREKRGKAVSIWSVGTIIGT